MMEVLRYHYLYLIAQRERDWLVIECGNGCCLQNYLVLIWSLWRLRLSSYPDIITLVTIILDTSSVT